jgi:hypothetical protein
MSKPDDMSADELRELAEFRARLLAMLTEGAELHTDEDDETVSSKLAWFFKMNETDVYEAHLAEDESSKQTVIQFENGARPILISRLQNKKLDFFTTQDVQNELHAFEKDHPEDYPSVMLDIGKLMLFVVQALHSHGIGYNLPTEINSSPEVDEDDDSWAL